MAGPERGHILVIVAVNSSVISRIVRPVSLGRLNLIVNIGNAGIGNVGVFLSQEPEAKRQHHRRPGIADMGDEETAGPQTYINTRSGSGWR